MPSEIEPRCHRLEWSLRWRAQELTLEKWTSLQISSGRMSWSTSGHPSSATFQLFQHFTFITRLYLSCLSQVAWLWWIDSLAVISRHLSKIGFEYWVKLSWYKRWKLRSRLGPGTSRSRIYWNTFPSCGGRLGCSLRDIYLKLSKAMKGLVHK